MSDYLSSNKSIYQNISCDLWVEKRNELLMSLIWFDFKLILPFTKCIMPTFQNDVASRITCQLQSWIIKVYYVEVEENSSNSSVNTRADYSVVFVWTAL